MVFHMDFFYAEFVCETVRSHLSGFAECKPTKALYVSART